MRSRGSITGPLVLIAIGVVFLIHAISPTFQIGEILAQYWPYLLIAWGGIELIEITVRMLWGRAIPVNGISGGAWLLIVLICIAGLTTFEVRRPGTWWRQIGFERGVQAFGEEHDYAIASVQKAVGTAPHIVIENFRGDAKITGTDGSELRVGGHKTIRAFDSRDADNADRQTPLDVEVEGNTVTIRCNQERAGHHTPVMSDLEISTPKGSSIEATGQMGDFDISSVSGQVDLSSDNAGVRLQDLDGNVQVDTHHSDLIRANNVKGSMDLRGHGTDVELTKIAGQVMINGDYTGTISLRDLTKPVRVDNMNRTELEAQQVPGEIRLDRGSLNIQNVVGPVRLTTSATDVSLDGFSNGLELTVDRGDIDLRPGRLPLGKMVVHTRSGNIELALPPAAAFALSASTDHGDIDNEFGESLKQHTEAHGAQLEGVVGNGPDVNLTTDRGSITVRKSSSDTEAAQNVAADER